MSVRLFVGNLPYGASEAELREYFGAVGQPTQIIMPVDRETGRPRGFAFVEFENDEAVQKCIEQMNGRDLKGRAMRVNAAEDRPPRPAGAPGGGFRPGAAPTFPPPEETGPDRGRRFKQKPEAKPARKTSPRRRRDDVVDDDDADY